MDALALQHAPLLGLVLVEARQSGLALLEQVSRVLEGDHQTRWRGEKVRPGRLAVWHLAGLGPFHGLNQSHLHAPGVAPAYRQHVAQHGRPVVLGQRDPGCAASEGSGYLHHRLAPSHHARHILLDHHVEIGAAKAESRQAAAPRTERRLLPRLHLGVHKEGHLVPGNTGIRLVEIDRGREELVVTGEHDLEQAGGACRALQMTDLRFDRAECNPMLDGRAFGEQLGHGLHFGHVPGPGRGAMAFQEGHGRGVQSGALPGATQGQDLPEGIGGDDAPTLTVAGSAHPADDRVDAIARLLRVRQALAHEESATLAHDEAAGVLVIGA